MRPISHFAADFTINLWSILTEASIWIVLGLMLAGAVHTLIPRRWLTAQLSGRGAAPIAKASLLGIPLPLCSCAVVPVAAGLRSAGASRGSTAAFAISTPQTGEESVPLTWALFGPVFAIARPIIAVTTAFTAGLLIERLTPDRAAAEAPEPKSCCCSTQVTTKTPIKTPEPTRKTLPARTTEAFRYGFGTMLNDLAPWLAVGLLLSALASTVIPQGWLATNASSPWLQMLIALAASLPLYICATASTPLAFILVTTAGLSPGAALVLLLAGPATNAATMSWALKDLGAKGLMIYVTTIAVIALAAGFTFDALFTLDLTSTRSAARSTAVGAHTNTILAGAAAGLLLALLFWSITERTIKALRKTKPAPAQPVPLTISN